MLRRRHQEPALAGLRLRQFLAEHSILDGIARTPLKRDPCRRDAEQVDDRRQIVGFAAALAA
jgi:hypothetical protein